VIDPNVEINNGMGGEWIANAIYVGDNIVLVANNENVEQF